MLLLTLISLMTTSLSSSADNVQVNAPSGKYVGLQQQTYDGTPYSLFKGIQYGKAKRFQESELVADSNEVKNATEFAPVCYQQNSTLYSQMSEDCLFLNLYTPDVNGSLPVIVFIHGGAYLTGSPNDYSGEYFMRTKKVVTVLIAYRLNLFGFVYFDDPKHPANLGLRDQLLALKWVQKNIKQFGGDPTKVIINGQSAGAFSTNLLMLSKLSTGLITGGISESGPACSLGAIQPRCLGLERRNEFANTTGCIEFLPKLGGSADKLVQCLQKKAPEELLNDMFKMNVEYSFLEDFPPILEPRHLPNAFLTESPSLESSNPVNMVPWLVGVNSNEGPGLIPLFPQLEQFKGLGDDIFKGETLPNLFMYKYQAKSPKRVTQALRKRYGPTLRQDFNEFLYQLSNNDYFVYTTYRCLQVRPNSVAYTYYFNYTLPQDSGRGANHGDELPYIWNLTSKVQQTGNPSQVQLSNNLVDAWVHFATNLSGSFANTVWEKYNADKDNWLIINDDGVNMGPNPNRRNNTFWQSLDIYTSPKSRHCYKYKP